MVIIARFPKPLGEYKEKMSKISVLELCAGAGGQALGFEDAGFEHAGLVELDGHACKTLRFNRPSWNVIQADLNEFDARPYSGVDVVAAGLPCPPFSKAGKQLGENDERNLFPAALRVIAQVRPRAILASDYGVSKCVPYLDFEMWASLKATALLTRTQ